MELFVQSLLFIGPSNMFAVASVWLFTNSNQIFVNTGKQIKLFVIQYKI